VSKSLHSFKNHVALITFIFFFSSPSRWPQEWPKHVGDHCAIKLQPQNQVHLMVF